METNKPMMHSVRKVMVTGWSKLGFVKVKPTQVVKLVDLSGHSSRGHSVQLFS